MRFGSQPTVDEMFLKVLKDYWDCERFRVSGHLRVVKSNYENHIRQAFGHIPLSKVTRLMVDNWHKRIDGPIAANRSLEVLSKIFNWAVRKEIFNGANPCGLVSPHREKKRKRYATQEELSEIQKILFHKATCNNRTKVGATFLLTLIYSGARPRSLERAHFSDFHIDHDGYGHLTFDGKTTAETGEEETVIFPPQIVELIKALPKRKDGLIFGIGCPKKLWREVRKQVGCPDLWARDMRRTFATVGMSNGVKIDTIGELLNHRSTQTTKRYALLDGTARVKAVGDIARKMNDILGQKKVSGE